LGHGCDEFLMLPSDIKSCIDASIHLDSDHTVDAYMIKHVCGSGLRYPAQGPCKVSRSKVGPANQLVSSSRRIPSSNFTTPCLGTRLRVRSPIQAAMHISRALKPRLVENVCIHAHRHADQIQKFQNDVDAGYNSTGCKNQQRGRRTVYRASQCCFLLQAAAARQYGFSILQHWWRPCRCLPCGPRTRCPRWLLAFAERLLHSGGSQPLRVVLHLGISI